MLQSEVMDLRQVLDHFIGISIKNEFWEAFLRSKNEIPRFKHFPEIVHKYAEPSLLEDFDMVLKLCAYDADIYSRLSRRLRQIKEIVETVLTSKPLSLLNVVEKEVQNMYPLLVASALKRLSLLTSENHHYALTHIDASLWRNRDVVIAWGLAGGRFLANRFPNEFSDDEDLLLAFLKHHRDSYNNFFSSRLCSDKQFMLQAVKDHPTNLEWATAPLIGDWDLLLTAMADPWIATLPFAEQMIRGWMRQDQVDALDFYVDSSKLIREKLQSHDVFVKLMLGSIMASKGGSTPLSLLNQGAETSLAFTKPIAEYLGVPMGEELRMLRQARKNLALIGIHWESTC